MPTLLSDEDLLARLVGFDTTSSRSNLELVDFLCDYLDRPGARIHRNGPAELAKSNLIAEIGPGTDPESRAGLVLCGHTDVVPAQEPGWGSDPFHLTERDGALFGRGAADMKGFLALAANLFLQQDPDRLTAPLVLALTYDEEAGTRGAKHLCETWLQQHPLPRHAVVGEPTELAAIRIHKGYLEVRFTVEGRSAHSAHPQLGHNAIEPAGRLIGALSLLRRRLDRERLPSSRHFPEVPGASLNIGRVAGGTALNVVPDRAVVEVGLRLLPGMDPSAAADRLAAAAAEALQGERYRMEVLSLSPPLQGADDAPLYRFLCELIGQTVTPSAAYATDAGWLQRAGLECVIFGPGSIEVAHRPDEHLLRDQLQAARGLLERVVDRFCTAREPGDELGLE